MVKNIPSPKPDCRGNHGFLDMVNIPGFTGFFFKHPRWLAGFLKHQECLDAYTHIITSHHSKICHLLTNCHVREDQPAKPGEIRQHSRQATLVQAFFWGGGGGRMMIPRHPVISPDGPPKHIHDCG